MFQVPWLVQTATAGTEVMLDLMRLLHMTDAVRVTDSCDRLVDAAFIVCSQILVCCD